ncbi:NAD(P)/FAD-dependent oxidoreductase [Flagellimonas meridianipacifica]|uniref:Glycine/D-amino acid oxidase-like deaminating enzyme n=1 Tax=Flagellimonas meridianipacifica TaxID=1080225 RepID=A0A2T0MFG3_9FLAO|nr:FAD-binding oxidoreductase [Allomuricauda pacifica]PRX56318.1 glycine/D-amino acid oxidase-like deaminating enzyme [Allomuricauda pacifica]
MLDYLVVGCGLAGISFCEILEKNGKSFHVVSDDSQQSSLVAGGLYNPVILKRFTLAWKARQQMDLAMPFYQNLEEKLKVKLDYKLRVLRLFASIEEQNGWFEAADKPDLDYFLSTDIHQNLNLHIDAPLGFGEVLYTGRVDTHTLLEAYSEYLTKKELFAHETFDFSQLRTNSEHITYKSIFAKQIVFADGYGLKNNPFFKYLPLNGTKGELLTIKAPGLKEQSVIKSSVFIIPLGDDLYRVGATYKWKDKTNAPTQASKEELLTKLKTFLKCDFQVVAHVAGIRPTVVDRRPLVGEHPIHKNLYCLNGFGSRGVLIAPYAAEQLFGFVENRGPIDPEINLGRFTEKYHQELP